MCLADAILNNMFDSSNLVVLVAFIVTLFVSISLHEVMHAYVAYRLGDDLAHSKGRISLNPLNHIDPMLTIAMPVAMLLLGFPPILAAKPVPINTNRISGDEMGLAAVGLAGPITNLALATVGALIFRVASPAPGVLADVMGVFIQLNVALFVFNMLPFPPLDGSRLLYAVAPSGLQRLMERIEAMGIMITIMLLVLLLPVIGPVLDKANNYILNILYI